MPWWAEDVGCEPWWLLHRSSRLRTIALHALQNSDDENKNQCYVVYPTQASQGFGQESTYRYHLSAALHAFVLTTIWNRALCRQLGSCVCAATLGAVEACVGWTTSLQQILPERMQNASLTCVAMRVPPHASIGRRDVG